MKITDKQRIDFVQREGSDIINRGMFYKDQQWQVGYSGFSRWRGKTWRQAVDKAIKAYMGGKK